MRLDRFRNQTVLTLRLQLASRPSAARLDPAVCTHHDASRPREVRLDGSELTRLSAVRLECSMRQCRQFVIPADDDSDYW